MKKIVAFSLLFLVAFALQLYPNPYTLNPAYAASASLSLSPTTGTFNKGCSFSLDVKLDTGGAATDGTDAIIFYDPTRFSATAIRSGTIYSDYPGNTIDAQTGRITVSGLASASTSFTGSGVLASVDFTVLETAPSGATQVKFDFDPNNKGETRDSNVVERSTVADVLNQVTNGNYTVGTGTCVRTTPGPRGGLNDSSSSATPTSFRPQVTELPQGGTFETTLAVVGAGAALIILGILGLALL